MKAFLLAAGLGTRLQPITNITPKCLVEVAGRPMLDYWFSIFRKYGITEVLINLNHFPDQVKEYIQNNSSDINVTLVYEEKLLGSLGTLLKNQKFVENEKSFFVFYSDTLTNINLKEMYEVHQHANKLFTMGLFRSNNPSSCGIVKLDASGCIIDFEEKPTKPKSELANAGVYIIEYEVLKTIKVESDKLLDIGFDLLPKFINNMQGYLIDDFIIDMGTHANLAFANDYVSKNQDIFNF